MTQIELAALRESEAAIALLSAAAHDAAPRAPAVAARWFETTLDLLTATAILPRQPELLMPLAASLAAAGRTASSRGCSAACLRWCPATRLSYLEVVVKVALADQMPGRPAHARQLIEQT